ncbi:adenylate/guanylate cyclase domain-containing protein [Mesorhizobium sp.]|uniref:adenylate/guanylate cyclase domain-containing protein n=1 Tax=Mesorhizobium sp. TaxID=1871066 RepID=UPI000FE979E8|nr:adenylate/guanylate cyclase domain-containing protein [Mesorhizobium sp.]RWO91466.1 MAG: adenylate/guanylate cyclase domain-containing protein [Mesorhizobium sp.]RWQ56667.1 MAG: adenylate/guanylate cyclase domain-containing protein [Mesorhizobium sp.]
MTSGGRAPTEIDALISEVEQRNELRTALWRFVALLVFALSVALEPDIANHEIHLMLLSAYAAITFVAVGLVTAQLFRPWLNWVYVAVDGSLIIYLTAEHLLDPASSLVDALATPSLVIAFVLLSHASMRMRAGPVAAFALIVILGSSAVALMPVWDNGFGAVFRLSSEEIQAAGVRLAAFTVVAAIQIVLVLDIRRLVQEAVASSSERANLTRFFAPETAERLATEGANLGLRRQEAAILFVDIRGFTRLSETMPLEEIASLVTEYRRRVTQAVSGCDGVVDKFIGDGVMAVFGFPSPLATAALRAFECAVELSNFLDVWSEIRVRDGEEPLGFAIGVHYGHVIGGVISGEHHSEYTVIGDSVNLAARLQAMCKLTEARIVISDELAYKLPRHWRTSEWQTLRAATVPGRSEAVDVHLLPIHASRIQSCQPQDPDRNAFTAGRCAATRAAPHGDGQARTRSASSRA